MIKIQDKKGIYHHINLTKKGFFIVVQSIEKLKIKRSHRKHVSIWTQVPQHRPGGPVGQGKKTGFSSCRVAQTHRTPSTRSGEGQHMLTLCRATLHLRETQIKVSCICLRCPAQCKDTSLGSDSCDCAQSLLMLVRVQRSVCLHLPAQSST